MRYNDTENTILVGMFNAGDTVTIKVINMITDTLETLTSNICTESAHIAGSFLWNMNNISSSGYKNFMYEMDNGTNKFYGKFVYGGTIDANIQEVNNVQITTADDFKSSADIQTLLTTLESNINQFIVDHEDTIQVDLASLDSGLRQVLTGLGDKINENEVIITNSNKTMTVII